MEDYSEDELPANTDDEFVARLTVYLGRSADGVEPETPVFKNDDGSINREKTLALPCYWNFR
jgi:hypothetical protein